LTYIFGIVAGICLIGHGWYMPGPFNTGNESLSDALYIAFMVFAGLTLITYWENK